jgi:hypothetical protein
MTGILQKSSDTGVSRLSLAMPVQRLLDTYKGFGFGRSTGLGLTGESSGLLPERKFWSQLDRATFSFGYGLMVTPHDHAADYRYGETRGFAGGVLLCWFHYFRSDNSDVLCIGNTDALATARRARRSRVILHDTPLNAKPAVQSGSLKSRLRWNAR